MGRRGPGRTCPSIHPRSPRAASPETGCSSSPSARPACTPTPARPSSCSASALERYGRRPVDLLEEWGWLAGDVTLAHLCEVTDEEIARIAAAGVTATHAPGCDVPMGWGVARVAALAGAGIVVGLGTSGGGSNDAGHLLADARLAMQVSGLVGAQLPARSVLAMATEGSAVGLGRAELGHLRPGAAADVCVWDVSGVADAGVADPVAGLLWAAPPPRRPRGLTPIHQPIPPLNLRQDERVRPGG